MNTVIVFDVNNEAHTNILRSIIRSEVQNAIGSLSSQNSDIAARNYSITKTMNLLRESRQTIKKLILAKQLEVTPTNKITGRSIVNYLNKNINQQGN